uniref:HAUS augmin-like complex, subunit 3 n=1 Tax=Xiphophorus couchianus TaxID=32473 RepID=A0A3B5LIS5_9TELE
MLNGAQFVEAMGRLAYPGAASLQASEFDWLFDCAPENLHFLRFVCRTLNQRNVLTTEEAVAFQELQKSGKHILDETSLAEVLKTIGPSDGSSTNILGHQDLEAEIQALCKEKELKQRRYNKLQVAATSHADVDLQLGTELDSAACKLKEAIALIGAENADTNAVLQNLTDEVGRLGSFLPQPEARQKADQLKPSISQKPKVLLSQLSLDPYLNQEELNTKTLTAFTQKHFFHGISDIVETSCSEHFQVLDLSSYEDEKEKNTDCKSGSRVVEHRRTEMARLQWSHIVAEHQLMQALAEEKAVKAGLDWLSEKARHTKLLIPISVEAEMEALLNGPVPSALRESARLLNVPVVRGDLTLQLARQNYYISRQDQVSHRGRSEPFQTYEGLDQAAQNLRTNIQLSRDSVAGARREQHYIAARLYSDCEALHRATYTELQQLLLGPQELTLKLVEVDSQLKNLQQVMQEILGEVKAKRSQLERNPLLRRERELYIFFHLDTRLLQKVVEDLENKIPNRGDQ